MYEEYAVVVHLRDNERDRGNYASQSTKHNTRPFEKTVDIIHHDYQRIPWWQTDRLTAHSLWLAVWLAVKAKNIANIQNVPCI